MDRALATVIGMSLAYVASLAGLLLAWWSWHRRGPQDRDGGTPDE
jgi:hypothetical protein